MPYCGTKSEKLLVAEHESGHELEAANLISLTLER